jgi:hypothetical protein
MVILQRYGERVEERPDQLGVPRLEALLRTGEHDQDALKTVPALERADERFCARSPWHAKRPVVLGREPLDTVGDLTASAPGQESRGLGR